MKVAGMAGRAALLAAAALLAGCVHRPAPVTGPIDAPYAGAAVAGAPAPAPGKVYSAGPKKRVAVVKFEDKSAYGKGRLGGSIREILETELSRSDKFILVTRKELDAVLDEQEMAKGGMVKAGTGPKAGELLGANAVITGVVSQFGVYQRSAKYLVGASKTQTAEATVDVQLLDATTGRILWAESGSGIIESSTTQVLGMGSAKGYDEAMESKALRAAIAKFVDNLVARIESMEWTGKVAAVESGRAVVNAGRKTGLAPGTRLKVYGEGKEVFDPDTKLSLGRMPGRLKGEIVVEEHFGEDASLAGPVSGAEGIAANDIVKLAQ
jgi:curli biogenesis system outer membrane secretion channel CsgG